jgi:hypothetical protein
LQQQILALCLHISYDLLLQVACEAGTTTYMSKRESFVEATGSLLAAFTNIGGDAVNSNNYTVSWHDCKVFLRILY